VTLPQPREAGWAAAGRFGADGLAFAVGVVTWVEFTLLGRLYLGELFLGAASVAFPLLYARLRRDGERQWVTAFGVLSLAYVCALGVADLYRQNAAADYLRGWARALVYLTNIAGLLVLGYRRPERLMLFLGGTAVSQILLSLMGFRPSDWKFGFAYPISVGVLLLLDSRRRHLTGWALLGLAGLHLVLDYRSFAGFFLVTALAVLANPTGAGLRLRLRTVLLTALAVLGFGALYSFTSRLGTQEIDVAMRRMRSNAERAAGLIVGYQFVRASPLLGYGSWPRSDEALETWAVLRSALGSDESPAQVVQRELETPEGNVIRTHSMILQAWVEAGIVGLVFFLFSTGMLAGLLARLLTRLPRDRYYAVGCFFGLWGLWAFIASPFAGISRLNTAISIVLLVVLTSGERSEASGQLARAPLPVP
jgi:hypothetical protein